MPACIALFLVAGTGYWLFRTQWSLGHNDWNVVPGVKPPPLSGLSPALFLLALLGGLAIYAAHDRFRKAKTRREQNASVALGLVSLSVLAFAWPFALAGPVGINIALKSTWSDVANGYFSAAYDVTDVRDYTRQYHLHQTPRNRAQAHVPTHPPGAVLMYYGARRSIESVPWLEEQITNLSERLTGESAGKIAGEANLFRRTAAIGSGIREPVRDLPLTAIPAALWCAILVALAGALTVPAVYLLATHGSNENGLAEGRGLFAAGLFVLAPNVALYNFSLDIVIMCGIAWLLVLAQRRWRGSGPGVIGGAGLLFALVSYVSFGALACGALVLVGAVAHYAAQPGAGRLEAVRRTSTDMVYFGAGFVVGWLVLMMVFPMSPVAIFTNAMHQHHEATVQFRDRWWWAWLNLVFFALFMGWPLAVSVAAAGGRSIKGMLKSKQPVDAGDVTRALGMAAVVVMLLLTLSGNVLGEVERLWLFLVPPCCAYAATLLNSPVLARRTLVVVLLLIALQASQTVMMEMTLAPLIRPM